MLSDAEIRVLATHCVNHAVARCDDCQRDYKFAELGIEIIGRRYYLCPLCRLDFVDDLRLHILGCRSVAAALEEREERSQLRIKESRSLVASSAVLAADSQALAERILNARR